MKRVIDLECYAPASLSDPNYHAIERGRPGTPFPDSLERPAGYGFANYQHVFAGSTTQRTPGEEAPDDGGMEKLVADMDHAGIEAALLVGTRNASIAQVHRDHPGRFLTLAVLDPRDGMRAVRELERLVREDGAMGIRVNPLYTCVPANDRRYYPLYAKCVELDVPIRVYTSMNYANDRPYDLGHPRHIDDVAVDFPELRIVAGLSGWPWVADMVGLLRRHPNLYCDNGRPSPATLCDPGLGLGTVPPIRQHLAARQDYGRLVPSPHGTYVRRAHHRVREPAAETDRSRKMALSQRSALFSDRLEMFRDVAPLVQPRMVAVVGASARRVSQGNVVIANLREWGFSGRVVPVHPTADAIDGVPAVASPDALPEATDLAVVAIPAAGVGETLIALERAGVRAAIVFANGFTREDERAVRRFVETSNIVVHGPNCMGLINVSDRVPLYPTRPSERLRRGTVALVAQSGSAAISVMNSTGVGFSKVITVGSEFQASAADYVRWLAGDAATSVIGVVTERIGDPTAFAEAAERAHTAGKTVVALKVGTSDTGVAAAEAHTGALIGKRDAYDRYFAECDIATVSDYDELIASLECMAVGRRRLERGARIGVVGISGGQTALACDVAEQAGVSLARFGEATRSALKRFLPGATGDNPVDIGATVREEERQLRDAVEAVLADDDVSAVALIQDAQASLNPRSLESYKPILSSYSEAGKAAEKPVVMISPTAEALHEAVTGQLTSHAVPVVRGLREGFAAIGNLTKGEPGRAGAWAAARTTEGRRPRPEVEELRNEIDGRQGVLSASVCHRLLDLYGIARATSIVVATGREGVARAAEIGFPMVVKVVSNDIPHRTDVGGVVVGVENEEALTDAVASIATAVRSRLPDATIDGFELSEELVDSVEAMAGFTASPPFGALMAVGTGRHDGGARRGPRSRFVAALGRQCRADDPGDARRPTVVRISRPDPSDERPPARATGRRSFDAGG